MKWQPIGSVLDLCSDYLTTEQAKEEDTAEQSNVGKNIFPPRSSNFDGHIDWKRKAGVDFDRAFP